MTDLKNKLDKWATGWRLLIGVVGSVVMVTAWIFTFKIETIQAINALEMNLTRQISEIRAEMLQSSLTYHGRVDMLTDKIKDIKDVDKAQWDAIRRVRERK